LRNFANLRPAGCTLPNRFFVPRAMPMRLIPYHIELFIDRNVWLCNCSAAKRISLQTGKSAGVLLFGGVAIRWRSTPGSHFFRESCLGIRAVL
jgi:hypothetical protein